MSKIILADSGYWIGLLDANDPYNDQSMDIASIIEDHNIVMPWPCLYETISTRLVRRRNQVILLEQYLSRPNISLLDDNGYKSDALEQVLLLNRQLGLSYSLTDGVIREILKDVNVKVDFLVTFNQKDFFDICNQRQIEIIDSA
jgi:hypothetical protein